MHGRNSVNHTPVALALVWLAANACSSAPATNLGPPGGLDGRKLPQPVTGSGAGDAAVASPDPGEAGAGKTEEGSARACSVSWASDIFPAMTATGAWRCADSSCHGGFQSPKIGSDSTATYAALAGYAMALAPQKLPYVLPGNPDPTLSGIECNLSGTACGNQMPLTTTGAHLPTAMDLVTLDIWVRCGAPEN